MGKILPISLKDIPAQWAKIRQGLDIFRISSKGMSIEWRSLRKFDRSVFTQLNSKVGGKCMGSYGSYVAKTVKL